MPYHLTARQAQAPHLPRGTSYEARPQEADSEDRVGSSTFLSYAESIERYAGHSLQGTMVFRLARTGLDIVPSDPSVIERQSSALRLVCELAHASVPDERTELCFSIAYRYHRNGHIPFDDLIVLRNNYAKIREVAAAGSPMRRCKFLRLIQIREYFFQEGLPVFPTGQTDHYAVRTSTG